MVDRLEPAEVQHLVEDLGGAQVAAELHRARRAERARQRAARLRGDADRAASVAVAHQHCLDRMAVGGTEERLDGAVRGLGLVLDRERRERNRAGQLVPECARQVRHLLVPRDAARRPLPYLAGAEGGLAASGQSLFEEREIHAHSLAVC